ncbi:hypothetical protein BaRGS_00039114 [Batillaria attramentaria]|uniref:Fructose-bisphosphatase n=1 Tax=Batillaria attramentaria TaxID=370345 RepID=A0ABD0J498_9CAEN
MLFQKSVTKHCQQRGDKWAHEVSAKTDYMYLQDLRAADVVLKSTGGLTRGTGMEEEERLVWLLGMPACTEICAAMQHLTGVRYSGMNST